MPWPGAFFSRLLAALLACGASTLRARLDLAIDGRLAYPSSRLDVLAGLQCLGNLEEVVELEAVELGNVADVAQMGHPRIRRSRAQDLVVVAHLVPHPEHPDRSAGDQATREGRLVEKDERVKRGPVVGERVLDEAIVGRIAGRGAQHPVQPYPSRPRVHLVLVPLALRDLDDY